MKFKNIHMPSIAMICFSLFICGCSQKPQYLSGLWKSNTELTAQNNASYNIPKKINYYHYFDNQYLYSIMIENSDQNQADAIAKTITKNHFKSNDKNILITKSYILKNQKNAIKILNIHRLSIMDLNMVIDDDIGCYVYTLNSKHISRNFKEYFCQIPHHTQPMP